MQHWVTKFRNAIVGLGLGVQGQTSFYVHVPIAIIVIIAACLLQCSWWQTCTLLICIGAVLSLELMNSALESMARGLSPDHNPHVGNSLDMASAAVLVMSICAAIVGIIILGGRAIELLTVAGAIS